MNKQLFISIAKIAGVVFALYLFLVGINGLSSGIKHLTQPDVVEVGDMVQTKAKIDGINKKVWMLVEDINYNEGVRSPGWARLQNKKLKKIK